MLVHIFHMFFDAALGPAPYPNPFILILQMRIVCSFIVKGNIKGIPIQWDSKGKAKGSNAWRQLEDYGILSSKKKSMKNKDGRTKEKVSHIPETGGSFFSLVVHLLPHTIIDVGIDSASKHSHMIKLGMLTE